MNLKIYGMFLKILGAFSGKLGAFLEKLGVFLGKTRRTSKNAQRFSIKYGYMAQAQSLNLKFIGYSRYAE